MVGNKGLRSILGPCGRSEGCQQCGCTSPSHKRFRCPSYPWGSQGSRHSSRHYGNYHGIWDTRGHPIFRIQHTHAPGQHLCHKHQACSSRRHHRGTPYRGGSSTSRRGQRQSSHPRSRDSIGLHLSLYRQRRRKEAHQLCGRKPSSSTSETHQCGGSRDGSGEAALHSSTPQCG